MFHESPSVPLSVWSSPNESEMLLLKHYIINIGKFLTNYSFRLFLIYLKVKPNDNNGKIVLTKYPSDCHTLPEVYP